MDSDQKILAATQKQGNRLSFNFGEDLGPPLIGQFDELNVHSLTQWCNAVRGAYSARKDRQEAEKNREAAIVRGTSEQANPDAGVASGSGLPVPENVEGVKAAMAAGIESALVDLGRRRAKVQSDLRTLDHERAALYRSLSDIDDLVGYYEGLREKL